MRFLNNRKEFFEGFLSKNVGSSALMKADNSLSQKTTRDLFRSHCCNPIRADFSFVDKLIEPSVNKVP
jgi:hypothetical protein